MTRREARRLVPLPTRLAWLSLVSVACSDFEDELRQAECARESATCAPAGAEPPAAVPPAEQDDPSKPALIEEFHQSGTTATPGQEITLSVRARPTSATPAGTPLLFFWSSSEGALRNQINTATESTVTWTAPPCEADEDSHIINVSVSTGGWRTTSHSFFVTGPPTCEPGGESASDPSHARTGPKAFSSSKESMR